MLETVHMPCTYKAVFYIREWYTEKTTASRETPRSEAKAQGPGRGSLCSRYDRSRSRTNTRRVAIGHCADLQQETARGVEPGNRNHHRHPNLPLQKRTNGKFLREPGLRVMNGTGKLGGNINA